MPENNGRSPNRRSFIKTIGDVSLGVVALSSTVAAKPGDKSDAKVKEGDSIKQRIRKSDPDALYESFAA